MFETKFIIQKLPAGNKQGEGVNQGDKDGGCRKLDNISYPSYHPKGGQKSERYLSHFQTISQKKFVSGKQDIVWQLGNEIDKENKVDQPQTGGCR